MASATAFAVLKLVGGLYLLYPGIQTWRPAAAPALAQDCTAGPIALRLFRQGVIVEAANPKTAALFLALIPSFIDASRGSVAAQLVVFGLIPVVLNTGKAQVVSRLRQGSGPILSSPGVSLLLTRRPA